MNSDQIQQVIERAVSEYGRMVLFTIILQAHSLKRGDDVVNAIDRLYGKNQSIRRAINEYRKSRHP